MNVNLLEKARGQASILLNIFTNDIDREKFLDKIIQASEDKIESIINNHLIFTQGKWYILYVYSGKEKIAKDAIIEFIIRNNIKDKIFQVETFQEEITKKNKGGENKLIKSKYSGYLIIRMIYDNEIKRNLYTVLKEKRIFLSSNNIYPVSMNYVSKIIYTYAMRYRAMMSQMLKNEENIVVECPFRVGDVVRICSGPFENKHVLVSEINLGMGQITCNVDLFNRSVTTKQPFDNIEKVY